MYFEGVYQNMIHSVIGRATVSGLLNCSKGKGQRSVMIDYTCIRYASAAVSWEILDVGSCTITPICTVSAKSRGKPGLATRL